MSHAHTVALRIVALNGGDPYRPIHRDELRKLTQAVYRRTGANGALFGFPRPWMVKQGDLRYLTDDGRRRL